MTDAATTGAAGPTVRLRRERDADAGDVARIVGDAFGAGQPAVPLLVDALRPFSRFDAAGAGTAPAPRGAAKPLALIAELDTEPVGHVMLSLAMIDAWKSLAEVLVLSPLAVLPDRQGAGIGTALVAGAVALAREVGAPAVFLEGAPRHYGGRGFVAAEPLGFRRPSLRIPAPAFQVMLLPAYQTWMTGTLIYPPPFWDLDCVGLRDRAFVERMEHSAGS